MIIELQNQSIVELSVDEQGTTEEERNVAKTVVNMDARSNRIRHIEGLKFVFQNLSQLLLGHNELGVGAQTFSRSDFIQRIKMRNSLHSVDWQLSPLSLQLHSGSLCSGLPSWISALPATLRVLDISYNAIQMLTVCTCHSLDDPSTSNMKKETHHGGEEELIARYLRHISPNTISLFFSKHQFPVLEQLNMSHNLLSSEIEEVKELEMEWCRVLSLASTNNYEKQEYPKERCQSTEVKTAFSLSQLQTAVLHLDLSWNDDIRCVNDFLFSSYPSQRKNSSSCGRSLKKLFLEHCGLNDFWGLSAVSYYAPHLEEIHLTATSMACPLLESTTKNFSHSSENEKNETKRNRGFQKVQSEPEWLRTALLRLTISKKHSSNSTIPGLPSKYFEDVIEEIISSSTLLREFKNRVEQIIRQKIEAAPERTLAACQEEPIEPGKSLRGQPLSDSMYLDFRNVLLSVLVQLVVQNIHFVNRLSTFVCKETLLEAFYDEVRKLLNGGDSATSQINARTNETSASGSEPSSLLQSSFTSRKNAALYPSVSSTLSDENLPSKEVDYSHFGGEECGLTTSEFIPSSSGSSRQESSSGFIPTKSISFPQLNPTSSSTPLPSCSPFSVQDVEIIKKQRERLLEQAAYLERKVDLSFQSQQRILLELKMLEGELTANRNTIAVQTKHILSLKESKKDLAKSIVVNRSTVRKRNTEVFHGLTALQFRLRKQNTPEKNVTDKTGKERKKNGVSVPQESIVHKTRSEVLRVATSKEKIRRFGTRHPFSYSSSRFSNGERLARSFSVPELSNPSIVVEGDEKIVLEIPSHSRLGENVSSGSECGKLKPFQGTNSSCVVSSDFLPSSSPDCRLWKSFSSLSEEEKIVGADEVTPPAPSLVLPRMFSIIPPLPASSKELMDCSCQNEKKNCRLSSSDEKSVSRSESFLLANLSTLIERAVKTDQKHSTLKQIHHLIGLQ